MNPVTAGVSPTVHPGTLLLMAPTAFAPVWWVARWMARVVTALAMTAFTALTLMVGTGPASAADVLPTAPASVTLVLSTESTDAPADQQAADALPASAVEVVTVRLAAGRGRGWRPTTGVVPGTLGQRAPPLR